MTGHAPIDTKIVAECCFLDVGQGTCNIILLGDGKAIILDCGPRGFAPVHALRYFGVREIVALIVSHNDADHHGGVAQIVQSFPKQIGDIYLLEDRPARKTTLFPVIRRELQAGNLLREPIRLEANSPQGQLLCRSGDVEAHVLFPWMFANIDAREAGGRNRTSAVLAIQCGRRRIVFGGDLPLEGWRLIRNGLNGPISCDVLATPHHAGLLAAKEQAGQQHRWMYHEAVQCQFALVSVGSRNQYGHPAAEHVSALREAGARIMCTQITPQCCDDLERIRPGVITPRMPGVSSPSESRTGTNRSRNVACAGSVLVEIGPNVIRINRLTEHQAAVDRLHAAGYGHPLCRPICASVRSAC